LICPNEPGATGDRKSGNGGESEHHPHQQRQSALAEWLIGAGENEWQNRQNAGTQNREYAAHKSQDEEQHVLPTPRNTTSNCGESYRGP
jgi:hypothetical protein